jgi:D-alanyl-D-alanine carboxypeptidase
LKKIKIIGIVFITIIIVVVLFHASIFNFYSEYQNKKALAKIEKENPKAASIFKTFVKEIEEKTDWEVLIVSGYRTEAEQVILKKINAKNASPGKSKHNFAKAIDICAFRPKGFSKKWLLKSSSNEAWENSQIIAIAEKYNLTWGGNFKNYHDPVHFEVE